MQGPPGTGKSHTIVNLLCHFLSQGKRVLVTSQTPRALKVLREKIPGEILPLAVSLLGEDAESQQNLEYAVQGILRHDDTVNLKTVCKEIDSYAKQRATCLSRLAELHRLLRETREAETTIYSVAGTPYEGTAQAIAQKLLQDADRFAWFEDPIAETTAPPLTDSEFKEFFALWVRVKDLVGKPHHNLPDIEGLPTAEEFERAVEAWSQAKHDAAPFAKKPQTIRRVACSFFLSSSFKPLLKPRRKSSSIQITFRNGQKPGLGACSETWPTTMSSVGIHWNKRRLRRLKPLAILATRPKRSWRFPKTCRVSRCWPTPLIYWLT